MKQLLFEMGIADLACGYRAKVREDQVESFGYTLSDSDCDSCRIDIL